ncbi:hypothetical protein DAEQUDRAFT_737851 [Daedalea quercina L-15889]|uniref:Uncharacterized protein n=1 Tax=Daedalea quercina L-15889 TaxID=1314783 RepID=A0A165QSA0_9APHY|nr:hypothetical protein DAEQUDRAFT_737851 [Daedalea quercina L-15889]
MCECLVSVKTRSPYLRRRHCQGGTYDDDLFDRRPPTTFEKFLKTQRSFSRNMSTPEASLYYAGGLTPFRTSEEIHAALQWLYEQPHPTRIFLHDPVNRAIVQSSLPGFLPKNSFADVTVRGRKLHIYGSPLTPKDGSQAFSYLRQDADGRIHRYTDVSVRRPPACFDRNAAHPQLHVFSHIMQLGVWKACLGLLGDLRPTSTIVPERVDG